MNNANNLKGPVNQKTRNTRCLLGREIVVMGQWTEEEIHTFHLIALSAFSLLRYSLLKDELFKVRISNWMCNRKRKHMKLIAR